MNNIYLFTGGNQK